MTPILVHCEAVDGEAGWWAEDAAGSLNYSAFSDTLAGLKDLVRESCEIEGWPPPQYTLCSCTKTVVLT